MVVLVVLLPVVMWQCGDAVRRGSSHAHKFTSLVCLDSPACCTLWETELEVLEGLLCCCTLNSSCFCDWETDLFSFYFKEGSPSAPCPRHFFLYPLFRLAMPEPSLDEYTQDSETRKTLKVMFIQIEPGSLPGLSGCFRRLTFLFLSEYCLLGLRPAILGD